MLVRNFFIGRWETMAMDPPQKQHRVHVAELPQRTPTGAAMIVDHSAKT
jgi:hypothetical protein